MKRKETTQSLNPAITRKNKTLWDKTKMKAIEVSQKHKEIIIESFS